MENLEGSPTLKEIAAVVHLSPYHFTRQFKAATGLAPHQFVIARRIERAQHLMRTNGGLGLAEVAFRSGFANQSIFAFILSGSSASRRDSFGVPQESPKRTRLRQELVIAGSCLLLEPDAYQGNRVTSVSFSSHGVNSRRRTGFSNQRHFSADLKPVKICWLTPFATLERNPVSPKSHTGRSFALFSD